MKMGEVKNKESFVKGADWKIRESKNRERVLWQTVPIKNKGRVKNKGKNFVKGAVFPVKIKGKFWSATLSKLSPIFDLHPHRLKKTSPIFHWAQAAPTRYGDRSHWFGPLLSIRVSALCFQKNSKINAKIACLHAFLIDVEQSADGF